MIYERMNNYEKSHYLHISPLTDYNVVYTQGSPFRSCDPHFFAFVAHAPTPIMRWRTYMCFTISIYY